MNKEARKFGLKILGKIFLKFTGSCPTSCDGVASCYLKGFTNVFLQFKGPADVDIKTGTYSTLSVVIPNKEVLATFTISTRYNSTGKHDILEFSTEIGKNLNAMSPVAEKIARINLEFTVAASDFLVQYCEDL